MQHRWNEIVQASKRRQDGSNSDSLLINWPVL